MQNQQELVSTSDTETIKNEIANKNAIELTSTNSVAIAKRLQDIDTLGVAIKNALVEGINEDYAIIPNTNKPSLLQPGARKICMLYGLTAQYPVMEVKEHLILTKCELYLNGIKVSESYGSESIGTKRDLGWEQNKAIKIAQKRAFVGATLQVANLSKVFTQDTEDMGQEKTYTEDQKKNTYAVCDIWKKMKNIKCFSKQQFKDAWTKFTQDVKDLMGLDNAYDLGCDKALAEKFIEEMKHPHTIKDPNEPLGERVVGTLGTKTEEILVHQPESSNIISDDLISNYGKKGNK